MIFLPLAGAKARADAEDRRPAIVTFAWSHQPARVPHPDMVPCEGGTDD